MSRNDTIRTVVQEVVGSLKEKDDTDVVMVFFNESVKADGIQEVELYFSNDQDDAYEAGKEAAKNIVVFKKNEQKEMIKGFKKYKEEKGTALAPVLIFCCGLAHGLKYSRNQIILITYECSNVGYGNVSGIQKQQQHEAYLAQLLFLQIVCKYMIPNNIMVNQMAYRDSEIKFYISKKFLTRSGGDVCQIPFFRWPRRLSLDQKTTQEIIYQAASSPRILEPTRHLPEHIVTFGTHLNAVINTLSKD